MFHFLTWFSAIFGIFFLCMWYDMFFTILKVTWTQIGRIWRPKSHRNVLAGKKLYIEIAVWEVACRDTTPSWPWCFVSHAWHSCQYYETLSLNVLINRWNSLWMIPWLSKKLSSIHVILNSFILDFFGPWRGHSFQKKGIILNRFQKVEVPSPPEVFFYPVKGFSETV